MEEEKVITTPDGDDEVIMFEEKKRWVFFGLPFTFTKYIISPSLLTIEQGFLNRSEDDCYMYKVQDVKLTSTLFERLFGLGTIICYTGDVTNPELKLVHIKNSKEVKGYLLKASEEARIKRRTIHAMDISANNMDDVDDSLFE